MGLASAIKSHRRICYRDNITYGFCKVAVCIGNRVAESWFRSGEQSMCIGLRVPGKCLTVRDASSDRLFYYLSLVFNLHSYYVLRSYDTV